jgi:hypothetical protein
VVAARLLLEADVVTGDPPPTIEVTWFVGDGSVGAGDVENRNVVVALEPLLADGELEPLDVTIPTVLVANHPDRRYLGFTLLNTTPDIGATFRWNDGRGPALWLDLQTIEDDDRLRIQVCR